MLINEYLQLRGVTAEQNRQDNTPQSPASKPSESPFAAELKSLMAAQSGAENAYAYTPTTAEQLEIMSGVNFSRHAVERINQRNIDVITGSKLQRLSKGVELAESKGSDDALIIVDKTAFVVSVRSNKVITAVDTDDITGNVFTNIDSTVIM